jgi:hypothetical protein
MFKHVQTSSQRITILPKQVFPEGLTASYPTDVGNTLANTVIANYVVERILRAKRRPLHLTGMGRWRNPSKVQSYHRQNQCRCQSEKKVLENSQVIITPVLGLAGCHSRWKWRLQKWNWKSRYVVRDSSVLESYQSWMQPSSWGNQLQTCDYPPAYINSWS